MLNRAREGLLKGLLFLAVGYSIHFSAFAAEKIAPRKPQDLWAEPAPVRLPAQNVHSRANPARIPAQPAPSPLTADADKDIEEIQRHKAEQAKKMESIQGGFAPAKGAEAQAGDSEKSFFNKLIQHPRFVPFAVVEVAWFLAIFILYAWLMGFIDTWWVRKFTNLALLALYLGGSSVALPLGIFGKEALPYVTEIVPQEVLNSAFQDIGKIAGK